MCYTVTPGACGIRAVRDLPSSEAHMLAQAFLSRPRAETVMVVAPRHRSMSHHFVKGNRRGNRFDYKRGKRTAKRQHKPDWFSGYTKY